METTALSSLPPDIRFTRMERDLLDALAGHPNCILTRSYLLRNVWGYSDKAETRTVDVHIRRLRKKLEDHPGLQIHTIFGKGYMMEKRPATGRENGASIPVAELSVSL